MSHEEQKVEAMEQVEAQPVEPTDVDSEVTAEQARIAELEAQLEAAQQASLEERERALGPAEHALEERVDALEPAVAREGDAGPRIVNAAQSGGTLLDVVTAETKALIAELPAGNVAVVCPDNMVAAVSDALSTAGMSHGKAANTALDTGLTVVPVSLVKGLELDGVVVVDDEATCNSMNLAMSAMNLKLSLKHDLS